MTTSHAPTIAITVTLDPAPQTPAGFGVPTLFVDQAQGTGNPLDQVGNPGERYREYAPTSDPSADVTAGFITAEVAAAITAAFTQNRKLTFLRVCRVDTGGALGPAEVYADALTALANLNPTGGIWLLFMDSRVAATQVAFLTAVAALPYFLICQSSDGDWLTSGWPAAYSAVEDVERGAIIYHDAAAQWADVAWGANRAAFDPDNPRQGSVQWEAPILGVQPYTTGLTPAQVANAKAHPVAVLGRMGPSSTFVDPGHNLAGRAIYEVLTADWFAVRVREAMEALIVQQAERGRKIILNATGQAMVLAVVQGVVDTATAARHLVEGQIILDTPPLTAADLDARRITLAGEGQIAGSARLFVFDLYFTRNQVVVPS